MKSLRRTRIGRGIIVLSTLSLVGSIIWYGGIYETKQQGLPLTVEAILANGFVVLVLGIVALGILLICLWAIVASFLWWLEG